jgi:peptide chain release factor 2
MEEANKKIKELEMEMGSPNFWSDKNRAQTVIRQIAEYKNELLGKDKYNKGHAIMTIFSGAGGDDAEDFSRILYEMYSKYFEKQGWLSRILDENENDHGGYRNLTLEIFGPNAYGMLKGEAGVHRLVRLSPFNSKNLRQTSFSMVEVSPKIEKDDEIKIPENDLRVDISKAGGPGGQNVNKRETAVRITHIPTGISVRSTSERSQPQNREKAMEILKGKLFTLREAEKKVMESGSHISKTISIDWGNQIRSYVFHPYKMIKDHRTGVETSNIDKVLNGDLDEFIEAERELGNKI